MRHPVPGAGRACPCDFARLVRLEMRLTDLGDSGTACIVHACLLPYTRAKVLCEPVVKCCQVRATGTNSVDIGRFSIRTSLDGLNISIALDAEVAELADAPA